MPPAAEGTIKLFRTVPVDTSPTMTSSSGSSSSGNKGGGGGGASSKDYYKAGSAEIVTETKLTVSRLEQRRKLTKTSDRLVIVLVGLPARGKSFISRKLLHYVNWTGVRCKAFNVGKYRREAYAQVQAEQAHSSNAAAGGACDANFFSAENEQAAALRQRVAQIALDDMLAWLDDEEEDYWDEAAPGSAIDASRHSFAHSFSSRGTTRHHATYQKIAIFDATNSTEKRRQWVLEQCTSPEKRGDKKTGCVFVESLCTDEELLQENYRFKVSNSPDYKDMSLEEGMEDLLRRVRNYEAQYETITNDDISYVKIYNLSSKLQVNHIYGRMAKDLVPALMAWHIGSRPVFLIRPGRTLSAAQSDEFSSSVVNTMDIMTGTVGGGNTLRRLGSAASMNSRKRRGDTLCSEGRAFRRNLWDFLHAEVKEFLLKRRSVADNKNTGTSISGVANYGYYYGPPVESDSKIDELEELVEQSHSGMMPIRILTSTMPRAVETVCFDEYDLPCSQMSNLNPIDKGDFAGMEIEDIKNEDPFFFSQLQADSFSTRFPGGESYHDLVRRLNSVVIDIEQQVVPVVVVSHVSILQCLMAYFRNTPVRSCMTAEVPMHTVIKFLPARGGGWTESWHSLESQSSPEKHMVTVPSESEFSALSADQESTANDEPIWWGENVSHNRPKSLRKLPVT